MMIGYERYELRDTNPDITSMILLLTVVMFILGIIMAFTCESLPSKEIEQELLNKKCEYVKGYIDSQNMIPNWQKGL